MPKGLMIALGVEKPKPGLPPPVGSSKPSAPPPAAAPDPVMDEGMQGEDGKADPDEAGVVLASEKCGDCSNWHYDTGDCDAVSGNYKALDGCRKYFEAKSTSELGAEMETEPDADDVGTMGMNPQ